MDKYTNVVETLFTLLATIVIMMCVSLMFIIINVASSALIVELIVPSAYEQYNKKQINMDSLKFARNITYPTSGIVACASATLIILILFVIPNVIKYVVKNNDTTNATIN